MTLNLWLNEWHTIPCLRLQQQCTSVHCLDYGNIALHIFIYKCAKHAKPQLYRSTYFRSTNKSKCIKWTLFSNLSGIKTPWSTLKCMFYNGMLIIVVWVLLGDETFSFNPSSFSVDPTNAAFEGMTPRYSTYICS